MKNKSVSFWALLLLVFIIGGCTSEHSEKESTTDHLMVSDVNPNGDSELALLMRALFEDADSFRVLIAKGEGNINEEFVEKIKKSHEAIPTKPEMKPAEFDAFNQLLLNEAIALLESDTASAEKFNAMVDRCMDCHRSVCPGPTKRIKKLYIR